MINTELTEAEQVIFNFIQNNEGISKAEMAIRIGKSEKTVQRLISSLMKKQVIERKGSNCRIYGILRLEYYVLK